MICNKKHLKVYTDGATFGRNGKLGTVNTVGLGVWFEDSQEQMSQVCDGMSNNEAEFKALIWALVECNWRKLKHVDFFLDSTIVVNRANNKSRPKGKRTNLRMDYFQDQVLFLSSGECYTFNWIPREENRMADFLSKASFKHPQP